MNFEWRPSVETVLRWLLLTNCETWIITLRVSDLQSDSDLWPGQHSQFLRCFLSHVDHHVELTSLHFAGRAGATSKTDQGVGDRETETRVSAARERRANQGRSTLFSILRDFQSCAKGVRGWECGTCSFAGKSQDTVITGCQISANQYRHLPHRTWVWS